jgi:hypothetical protein
MYALSFIYETSNQPKPQAQAIAEHHARILGRLKEVRDLAREIDSLVNLLLIDLSDDSECRLPHLDSTAG